MLILCRNLMTFKDTCDLQELPTGRMPLSLGSGSHRSGEDAASPDAGGCTRPVPPGRGRLRGVWGGGKSRENSPANPQPFLRAWPVGNPKACRRLKSRSDSAPEIVHTPSEAVPTEELCLTPTSGGLSEQERVFSSPREVRLKLDVLPR